MNTIATIMHGLGNKFAIFDGPIDISESAVREICGSAYITKLDGLIVVDRLAAQHIRMNYWNSDGSVAEMCGNGLRCVVRYAIDKKIVDPGDLLVETRAGDLRATWDGIDPEEIEVQVGKVKISPNNLKLEGASFYIANVGNPHAITFVEDVSSAPVDTQGPHVEVDNNFPNKTNVEYVQKVNKNSIALRVWERGVGETEACGTGMVASAAAAVREFGLEYPLNVKVPGGLAKVWVDKTGYSRMIGPAVVLTNIDVDVV